MKKLIVAAHCLEMLALAVWIGGLVSIVIAVIPAVFNTIGVETGGRLLTRTFQGYDRLSLVAAGVLGGGMAGRALASGHLLDQARDQARIDEIALLGAMAVVAIMLAFYLGPITVRLQELAFAAEAPAVKGAAYAQFFRYHWIARGLYLVNLALGIILLWLKVGRWAR